VGGDGAVARGGRDVDRRLDADEGALEGGATLDLRPLAEVVVAERQQVPRDVGRGRLLGEHLDAARRGGGAQEQRIEVEAAAGGDHDLAVENAAIGELGTQLDLELGKVAAQRLEIAALDVDVIAALVDQRAKAVPLRLVDEAGALARQLAGQL